MKPQPLLSRPSATLSSLSEGEEREGRGVVGVRDSKREISARQNLARVLVAASVVLVSADGFGAERATDSWTPLFDGKTTAGWRGYGETGFPKKGWAVEDGCLKKIAGERGGNIVTEDEFNDFELEWEWKLPPKANNGVKYLVTEARPSAPGHEYQMVDDSAMKDPRSKTATFYDVLPLSVKSPVKPPGEWNTSRIRVQGNHVEHWLNGIKVLEYELGSAEVKSALANTKFKDEPGFGEKIKGRIMLTDHGDEAWFRKIQIRELPPQRP